MGVERTISVGAHLHGSSCGHLHSAPDSSHGSTDLRSNKHSGESSESPPVKRSSRKRNVIDLTNDDHVFGESPKKKSKKVASKGEDGKNVVEEKRLRRFREKAPQSFREIYDRAVTQRMFVLNRKHTGTPEQPSQTVELAGTTGNIYTITIDKVPTCDCPHARKGNQCKHIVYVMVRTLKAPSNLQYQLAFLSNELREIFARAPPLPSENPSSQDTSGLRKAVDDDCPICCVEFDVLNDEIVWCKAACGNNVHKGCFEQWAAQKKSQGADVTCPFCRTRWEGDTEMLSKLSKLSGRANAEGYVNVASELGLSGRRDYSTYHQFWVHRERREGRIEDEEDYYDYY